jgi:hypothetical protein
MAVPRYKHNCQDCIFIGEDQSRDHKERQVNYVDLYFHPTWKLGAGHYTRRWGSAPGDAWSISEELVLNSPIWEPVRRMAQARKIKFVT